MAFMTFNNIWDNMFPIDELIFFRGVGSTTNQILQSSVLYYSNIIQYDYPIITTNQIALPHLKSVRFAPLGFAHGSPGLAWRASPGTAHLLGTAGTAI